MMAGRVSFRREEPGVNGGEQGWQGGGSRRGTGGELTVKEEVHLREMKRLFLWKICQPGRVWKPTLF